MMIQLCKKLDKLSLFYLELEMKFLLRIVINLRPEKIEIIFFRQIKTYKIKRNCVIDRNSDNMFAIGP